jgi:RNA polymerase subunit RPABC4/transcription elongation factor Spt4
MRITLHSPLDCPGCGSRFEGAWVPGKETSSQACPSCAEAFTATWKGWTFIPEQRVVTRAIPRMSPLDHADFFLRGVDQESVRGQPHAALGHGERLVDVGYSSS